MAITDVKLRNLGTVNKNQVTIYSDSAQPVTIFFSYETPVAVDGTVSQNEWSTTTGKLLNELQPNKKLRVPHEEVLKTLSERLKKVV
jgi:hypothetical protein